MVGNVLVALASLCEHMHTNFGATLTGWLEVANAVSYAERCGQQGKFGGTLCLYGGEANSLRAPRLYA
eukprot:154519-Amphidinium_carterae.1